MIVIISLCYITSSQSGEDPYLVGQYAAEFVRGMQASPNIIQYNITLHTTMLYYIIDHMQHVIYTHAYVCIHLSIYIYIYMHNNDSHTHNNTDNDTINNYTTTLLLLLLLQIIPLLLLIIIMIMNMIMIMLIIYKGVPGGPRARPGGREQTASIEQRQLQTQTNDNGDTYDNNNDDNNSNDTHNSSKLPAECARSAPHTQQHTTNIHNIHINSTTHIKQQTTANHIQ